MTVARIRIDDLERPRYSEAQLAALEFEKSLEVAFDAETILNEASEQLSLKDFGNMAFLARLELLCDEWGNDPDLNNLGKFNLRRKLLLYARNRLLIQDTLKRHPEIHEVNIERPIIVAGLPRSGTTHLLNLLAADSRLRSLPLWESYEPVPIPGEHASQGGADPRYARCAEEWARMQQMVPLLAAMHPMNPDHIHEELELMGPDFASYNFEWLSVSPRWRDYYFASDQTPHYEYMRTVLQLLTWQDGAPRRWVLKCPQHLEQLLVLRKVFPDATLVVTHRDPVAVIQSAATMIAYGHRMSRRRVDPEGILDYWTKRIHRLLAACVRDRHLWPEAQSIDVLFHQFMADDMGMIGQIYERAELSMTEASDAALRRYAEKHTRGRHGQVVYDLKQDFAADSEDLRGQFGVYLRRFPVQVEREPT